MNVEPSERIAGERCVRQFGNLGINVYWKFCGPGGELLTHIFLLRERTRGAGRGKRGNNLSFMILNSPFKYPSNNNRGVIMKVSMSKKMRSLGLLFSWGQRRACFVPYSYCNSFLEGY